MECGWPLCNIRRETKRRQFASMMRDQRVTSLLVANDSKHVADNIAVTEDVPLARNVQQSTCALLGLQHSCTWNIIRPGYQPSVPRSHNIPAGAGTLPSLAFRFAPIAIGPCCGTTPSTSTENNQVDATGTIRWSTARNASRGPSRAATADPVEGIGSISSIKLVLWAPYSTSAYHGSQSR